MSEKGKKAEKPQLKIESDRINSKQRCHLSYFYIYFSSLSLLVFSLSFNVRMWFGDDEIIEGCYFHATLRYKQFSLRKTFHQKPNPLVKRVVNEFISSSFISFSDFVFFFSVFLPLTLAYFLQMLYPYTPPPPTHTQKQKVAGLLFSPSLS